MNIKNKFLRGALNKYLKGYSKKLQFIIAFSSLLIILIVTLLFSSNSNALEYSIPLMAVSDTSSNEQIGSIPMLSLELKKGTGRIFIDSFPFNRIDVQVSIRYARDMACKLSGHDCSQIDFFYIIHSDASVIGGPSAGSSIAFLTFAALNNLDYKKDIALSGTINSGYLIGPVGGLKEKIMGASQSKIKKVLIPAGERYYIENNETIDLFDYAKPLGIELVEVNNLYDVIFHYTGKKYLNEFNVTIDSTDFKKEMQKITNSLCEQAKKVKDQIGVFSEVSNQYNGLDSVFNTSSENIEKAKNQSLRENYYSAASLCFNSLNGFLYVNLVSSNITDKRLFELENAMIEKTKDLRSKLDLELKSLGDLQVYAGVIERVLESEQNLENFKKTLNKSKNINLEDDEIKELLTLLNISNESQQLKEEVLLEYLRNNAILELSKGINRLYSAELWVNFIGFDKKYYNLSEESLEIACVSKLSETKGYIEYFSLLYPRYLDDAKKLLTRAQQSYKSKDFALCIYQGSEAKAFLNNVMSSLYITLEQYNQTIKRKIDESEKQIGLLQEQMAFPIIGYSYYEYATSLLELGDVYSASLYSEYALELSNMDIYFRKQGKSYEFKDDNEKPILLLFFYGSLFGFAISMLIVLFMRLKK
ncbi:MAG TPA: hypothetical protein PLX15_03260 [Candidatus Woesearchaeota archaeon]|nr:hypothetical protein [Candidatus Woesearchaeota archaeon]